MPSVVSACALLREPVVRHVALVKLVVSKQVMLLIPSAKLPPLRGLAGSAFGAAGTAGPKSSNCKLQTPS